MPKNTWKTIFIILLVVTIGFALLAVLLDWLPTHFPPKGAPAPPAAPETSTAPPTPAASGTANSPASPLASRASAPAATPASPLSPTIPVAAPALNQSEVRALVDKWPVHDLNRPQPPVVTPGPAAAPVPAPPGAIVLFDGRDLSQWTDEKGRPAAWKVEDGHMEVVPKTGTIQTARGFGDCELHVEWMAPLPAVGEGQERGNSGVFLMGLYEVQVLDCYGNKTYPDGMTAALYGQYPPLVNACRKPGEWQTYDIAFRRPRFAADGSLLEPARMTVFHNGIKVHDSDVLTGPTAHKARPPSKLHADRLPISLQDHGTLVRFRDIWIRELE